MKRILLFLSLIAISVCTFSQDQIIRKNGTTIDCKIISVDTIYVNFTVQRGDTEVKTRVLMSDVEQILYDVDSISSSDSDPRTNEPTTIVIKPKGFGTRFYHHDVPLNNTELSGLLSLNKLAFEEYKKSKGSNAAAIILSFSGGFLVGWPLGTAIAGGDPNWYLAAAGAGLILLSIPFSLDAKEKVLNAVDIYNEGLNKSSKESKELQLGFSQNGIGIQLRF